MRTPLPCILLLMSCLALCACKSAPRDTRLQHADLNEMVGKMTRSLANSDLLNQRDPSSPRVEIVINRVRNLSADRITEAEQWSLIQRVRASADLQYLKQEKNIHFQLPPERLPLLRKAGFEITQEGVPRPDYLMSADIRSARRAIRDKDGLVVRMQDQYLIEFFITDLQGRKNLWHESYEIKRESVGSLID